MVQPVKPEGQEALVTADRRASKPEVWGHRSPRRLPVTVTKLGVQIPGRGPHSPALEEAMRRVRDVMPPPEAQVDGMVPVKELEPRFSWAREERALQAAGKVAANWLLPRFKRVSCDSADQEAGSDPLKELPGSWTVFRLVTKRKLAGRVPAKP